MITVEELKKLISQGETTTVQFKIRTDDAYKMGVEMVAFSNSLGGKIIIGINDKDGSVSGLTYDEIQITNNILSNAASDCVKPPIIITTETVNIDNQNIVVATVSQGKDKPYKDNKGIIWVKNGSDKRKVFSNSELRVMMQSCGNLAADMDSIEGTSYKDISIQTLKTYLYKRYTKKCADAGIVGTAIQASEVEDIVKAIDVNFTIEQLLQNILLMDSKRQLTLSGLLLLGKSIQRFKPVFTIKCISFVGNSIATNEFRDKMPDTEIEGNLLDQYNAAISFINRNLKSIQVEKEFNSLPRLEIPLEVFVETFTNALIHRDYYQNSPIRIFIFDNRIEIISPGILPDSVTEESIKRGISKPRNQLLFDNAKFLLPYTGIGSGIIRAMKSYEHINFKNDSIREEFVITIDRPDIPEENIYHGNKSDYDNVKSDYDGKKSDYDSKKSDYDDGQKSDYDDTKSDYDDGQKSDYDNAKSDYDNAKSDYDSKKSDYDDVKSDYDNAKSDYDGKKSDYDDVKSDYDGQKSDYDNVKGDYDSQKSDYDSQKSDYDDKKSDYDDTKSDYDDIKSDYDGKKSDYDNVKSDYDEKILTFSTLPKSRKEIMTFLDISTHTDNYERHIVPLLKKGYLTMTLPDKPKSKNQKYLTTKYGKKFIQNRSKNSQT